VNDSSLVTRGRELDGISEEDDLSLRAARLLKPRATDSAGATISVRKQIPAGAGLGGGSSDAASVLIALNTLWDINLDRLELARLGATLGADVPVFVRGHAAFAEGTGDRLYEAQFEETVGVVVVPPVHVSTPAVFQDPALKRDTPVIADLTQADPSQLTNDLQPVATRQFPLVADALQTLAQGINGLPSCPGLAWSVPRMSGSGGAVFTLLHLDADVADAGDSVGSAAQILADRLRENLDSGWQIRPFRTLNRHPELTH